MKRIFGAVGGLVLSALATSALAGPYIDLVASKTDGSATAVAGANIAYTIVVSNAGNIPASNVTLTDTLPAAETFVSLTSPGGWSCVTPAVGASGTITCSLPSLAYSASGTFTLTVTTSPSTPPGAISNTAVVTTTDSDYFPGNNSATDTDTLSAPPPPAPAPTLSEWAMIGLAALLAMSAVLFVRRRAAAL